MSGGPGSVRPARRVLVAVVGLDDALDQRVAHDVLRREGVEDDPGDVPKDVLHLESPEVLERGRSIWVMSPVTTILESSPSRVRNIIICSGVVFCASSRTTNAWESVRPRM